MPFYKSYYSKKQEQIKPKSTFCVLELLSNNRPLDTAILNDVTKKAKCMI